MSDNFSVRRRLTFVDYYRGVPHDTTVDILNIKLNLKNSCSPFSIVTDKNGNDIKVAKCREYPNTRGCRKCVENKRSLRESSRRLNKALEL